MDLSSKNETIRSTNGCPFIVIALNKREMYANFIVYSRKHSLMKVIHMFQNFRNDSDEILKKI
jgi:hypothetical protein